MNLEKYHGTGTGTDLKKYRIMLPLENSDIIRWFLGGPEERGVTFAFRLQNSITIISSMYGVQQGKETRWSVMNPNTLLDLVIPISGLLPGDLVLDVDQIRY